MAANNALKKQIESSGQNSNIDSQHSAEGVNSSSDRGANLSSSRNQNNSRLSNNTRMVNKVAAAQKKMDQRKGQDDSMGKVTQIKIHGANGETQRKFAPANSKTTKQLTEKREEEKRERSKGPESTSNGLSRNMNIASSKSNQIPKGNRSLSPGVPSVQDVDRIDDS